MGINLKQAIYADLDAHPVPTSGLFILMKRVDFRAIYSDNLDAGLDAHPVSTSGRGFH